MDVSVNENNDDLCAEETDLERVKHFDFSDFLRKKISIKLSG